MIPCHSKGTLRGAWHFNRKKKGGQKKILRLKSHLITVDRSVPRKPALQSGVKGHNMMKLPYREAPPSRGESFAWKAKLNHLAVF